MDAKKVAELKQFVEQCKSNPSIIHNPSLAFFKSYLQSLGARIPKSDVKEEGVSESEEHIDPPKAKNSSADKAEEEIIESDVELDSADVVEPDHDPPQKMGDPSIEVTEENRDSAQEAKAKALDAISEGKLDEAIDHLTEAILLNPSSAIMYATRASAFIKLKKPNAAIRDADAALQINPDSAKGYKVRGMARAMLGQWEAAAKDLHVASNIDFDEEIDTVLKKVEPNAHKLEEHRRKYERLRKEREVRKIEREKQRRRAEAQATYEKEKKTGQPSCCSHHDPESKCSSKEGQVIAIHSASELDSKIKAASSASRLAVLYFTATWCGPCRYIAPVFTSLAEKYPNVVFLKVDIDQANDAAAQWNVSSVPAFFFVKNGKEVDKVVGADKNSLESKLKQYAS